MWSCSIHPFLRVLAMTGRNSQPRKQVPRGARNLFLQRTLFDLNSASNHMAWARRLMLPSWWGNSACLHCELRGCSSSLHTSLVCVSPCPKFNSLCVCQSVCSSKYKISSLLRVVSKLCLPFRKEKQTFHRRSCFLWVSLSPFYSHSWLAVQLQFLNNTSWYSVWYLVKFLSREFYRIF